MREVKVPSRRQSELSVEIKDLDSLDAFKTHMYDYNLHPTDTQLGLSPVRQTGAALIGLVGLGLCLTLLKVRHGSKRKAREDMDASDRWTGRRTEKEGKKEGGVKLKKGGGNWRKGRGEPRRQCQR